MRKDDIIGRVIGIVVFVGGIALMAFVFVTAYSWFTTPSAGLQTAPLKGSSVPATAQLGQSAVRLLVKIGLLLIMTAVGSLLAGRGVQLYFAATNAKQPPIYPKDE